MKVSSAFLALATLAVFSVNLSGVTGRALGEGNLVTTGSHQKPSHVGLRGLTGVKPGKGGKGGDDGSPGGSGGDGGSTGGIGGLGAGGGDVIGGLGATPPLSAARLAGDRELDGFGLLRNSEFPQMESEGAFQGFEAVKGKNWNQFRVGAKPDRVDAYGNKPIFEYQTVENVNDRALNTKWVETKDRNLPDGVNRRTLIKNGWTSADGHLGKLKALGDSFIINSDVRRSIEDAFHQKGKDIGKPPLRLTFFPDQSGWDEINNNAFIGGYSRMLSEDPGSFKGAKIAAIRAIVDSGGDYHLITILSRPKRPASESSSSELSESSFLESVSESE